MSEMVTVETLTDETIRAEWATALDRGDRPAVRRCQIALNIWGNTSEARDAHRQRICDAINARRAKEQP